MTSRHSYLAEAIGTYFLVLIGPGAAMVDVRTHGALGVPGIALAFAVVVIAMVWVFGPISGAHINPAVTVALWSARRFPARDVIPYVLAQCVGAVAASATLRAVMGPVGQLGATVPGIAVPAAFAVEWLLSFALMLVILAAARGVPVGLTVGLCALAAGPLTGASMNPARSFGPALVAGVWRAHWIYWIAPMTAMAAAAWVHRLLSQIRANRRDTALVATKSDEPDMRSAEICGSRIQPSE
jgi:MIP family channel proteins